MKKVKIEIPLHKHEIIIHKDFSMISDEIKSLCSWKK